MREREAALACALAEGVGPATARRLLGIFGTYRGVIEGARRGGVPGSFRGDLGRRLVRIVESGEAAATLERARTFGARYVVSGDEEYPGLLEEIGRPPIGVFVRGRSLSCLGPMVAIVGTRAATPRGLAVAGELASGLAAGGFTIVSGMARGIDTAAHRGAMAAGGATVAILGSGLARAYPPENASLGETIAGTGAVVSEHPIDRSARPEFFPQRNRIIAGLAVGTVVVEAGRRSGALITASFALECGREVFAVPGPIEAEQSRGPHALLRDGAVLVEGVRDVLDELEAVWGDAARRQAAARRGEAAGRSAAAVASGVESEPRGASDGGVPARILSTLGLTPMAPGALAAALGVSVQEILAALVELELSGRVLSWPGGRYTVAGRPDGGGCRR